MAPTQQKRQQCEEATDHRRVINKMAMIAKCDVCHLLRSVMCGRTDCITTKVVDDANDIRDGLNVNHPTVRQEQTIPSLS